MSIAESPVTHVERVFFDLHGFIIVPSVLTPDECGRMIEIIRKLERDKADDLAKHDQVRLDGMPQMDPIFDIAVGHPRIMPYLREFLDRPQLANTWCITKGPRANLSSWHRGFKPTDYSCRDGVIRTRCLNSGWLLTDNNHGDGGLGVLPASHKNNLDLDWAKYPGLSLPGSVEVVGKAGDVVLFSECLIHTGLPKSTPGYRTNLYYNHCDLNLVGANLSDATNLHIYSFPQRVRDRFTKEQLELTAWMNYVNPAIHDRKK